MFDGSDTARYLALGHNVVSVEANPFYVKQAQTRFAAEIREGRLKIEPVGIAEESGTASFWVVRNKPHKSTFVESFARRVGGDEIDEITVETRRLHDIMATHGRGHYVKIDIEESDELCLGDLEGDLMPDYVSAEMGPNIGVLTRLNEVGFRDFKCISQFTQLPLPVADLPNPAEKERIQKILTSKSVPLRLMRRAGLRAALMRRLHPDRDDVSIFTSGDFGDMTSGRWRDFDEMFSFYTKYMAESPHGATWVDAHARAPHMAEA